MSLTEFLVYCDIVLNKIIVCMKRFSILAVLAVLAALAVSCGGSGKKLLPNVSGKAGEVIVVINQGEWEGEVGDGIRTLLASDCPFLPQKEPLYTLVNITPSNFTNIFQIHRNLLLVDVDHKTDSSRVEYRTDVWASPQCVISVIAKDSDTALSLIEEQGKTIQSMLEQAERDRIIANSKLYEETSLRPVVNQFIGGSPYFPAGYKLKKQTGDFMWIAYDTQILQDIFIYKYPAEGKDDFSAENLVAKRNEFLKNNVPGMFENTYMTTSNITMPSVEYMKYKGRSFAEMRGFWEVYNDYMGGPFVSHAFYSQDGKEIIVLEAFVYAPKYDKRNYLREVESILYSFEWNNSSRKK